MLHGEITCIIILVGDRMRLVVVAGLFLLYTATAIAGDSQQSAITVESGRRRLSLGEPVRNLILAMWGSQAKADRILPS